MCCKFYEINFIIFYKKITIAENSPTIAHVIIIYLFLFVAKNN